MRPDARWVLYLMRILVYAMISVTALALAVPAAPRVIKRLLMDPDVLGLVPWVVAIAGLLVGLAWIMRINRPDQAWATWRSGVATRAPVARRLADGEMRPDVRRARETARIMLGVTIGLPFIALFLWIAAPAGPSPMFGPPWYAAALPWLGAAGYLVGLGWMIRIYRARPEGGERTWRYRAIR